MTGALLEAPLSLFSQGARPRAPGGRRVTLEERLDGIWRGVTTEGAADCPVCHTATMRWEEGAGRCSGCGSTLS